jgi:hypothetical protein
MWGPCDVGTLRYAEVAASICAKTLDFRVDAILRGVSYIVIGQLPPVKNVELKTAN